MESSIPISPDGILERSYLRQEQAEISFRHNALVTNSNPITPIPFVDRESQKARELPEPKIKLFTRILKIRAVSTHDGICRAFASNTTENDINIEIAPQVAIPFNFCEFPGEEFSDSRPECSTLGSQGCRTCYES